MTMLLVFVLVFSSCFLALSGHKPVDVWGGRIRGKAMTTRNGRNISAYLGIPYAEPIVGSLRFTNPRINWKIDDDFPGDVDGNVCPQLDDDGKLIGDEDCLFVNIYTPQAIDEPLYPVMVYFHGGNFIKGSGGSTEAGPEYLLDRDIVLVTVNYRLGALGFLSTGDDASPGNFGLKDQSMALYFIRVIIGVFGGDWEKVTIFGQGAGGVSTSLHAIAPGSRGLFRHYISQSGNAFAFWGMTDINRYKDYSKVLGKKVDCSTENSRVLVECLRKVDVYSLVNSIDIFENEYFTFGTWGPTIEKSSDNAGIWTPGFGNLFSNGAFLDQYPLHEILNRGNDDIPSMIGNVVDEGLFLTAEFRTNDTYYEKFARNHLDFFVFMIKRFWTDYMPTQYANNAEQFYFNGSNPDDKDILTKAITEFVTDAAFIIPMAEQIRFMTDNATSPCYVYSFDYRGTFSHTSLKIGTNENIGVTHFDDLIYLFPMNPKLKTSPELQLSDSDEKMIDIMIDLWTSFASTGIPIADSTSQSDIWKPWDGNLTYLEIGNQSDPELNAREGLRETALAFWQLQLADQLIAFLDL